MSNPLVTKVLLSPLGSSAVAAGDTGTIIKIVRQALGWNQHDLAKRTGYSQPTISRLERGQSRAARDMMILSDFAAALGIAPAALGLVPSPPTSSTLDEVDRRKFFNGALTIVIAAMLPQAIVTPGRIGAADVAHCWTSLRRLFELDDRHGGVAVYQVAARIAQHLQDALRRGSYTPQVGSDLRAVTAATMEHAGWLAYDAGMQDQARRWWLETCHLSDPTHVPEAHITALASMALQASAGPASAARETIDLAHAARAAAGTSASPTLLSVLAAREAVGLAKANDATAANSKITESRRYLDQGRRGDEPLWLNFWGEADLASHETRVYLATGKFKSAETSARTTLANADVEFFPRNHSLYEIRLTSILIRSGQLDEAISIANNIMQRGELILGSQRISTRLLDAIDSLAQQSYRPAKSFAAAARQIFPRA